MDSYKTISAFAEGVFKDKGSKFLAFALPVKTEEDALKFVKQKRKEFFDARHVCWAYMLGTERINYRANDDGEPSGTAGKQILGKINSNELTDIVIVVVRYFGGTLLGTSGLINAYKTAAADALANAQIVEIDVEKKFSIVCNYENLNFVMKIIKDFSLKVLVQKQSLTCEFTVSCKQKFYETAMEKLKTNFNIKITESQNFQN
ncbi:MAG: YigZ family protein [Prevotellaceae bacterium]|jgi:uncharacterized YigZ family protein|nr:YigZ family protein [Prevotellaceae bacterium]